MDPILVRAFRVQIPGCYVSHHVGNKPIHATHRCTWCQGQKTRAAPLSVRHSISIPNNILTRWCKEKPYKQMQDELTSLRRVLVRSEAPACSSSSFGLLTSLRENFKCLRIRSSFKIEVKVKCPFPNLSAPDTPHS